MGSTTYYPTAGNWIRLLTGDHAGEAYPILAVTHGSKGTYTLDLPATAAEAIAEGDTWDEIAPPVHIDCATLELAIESSVVAHAPTTLCNVIVHANDSAALSGLIRAVSGGSLRAAFVQVRTAKGLHLEGFDINSIAGLDETDKETGLAAVSDCAIANLATCGGGPGLVIVPAGSITIATPGDVRDLVVLEDVHLIDASSGTRTGFDASGEISEEGVTGLEEADDALDARVSLLEETTAAITLYVDPDGSDTTGTGAKSAPFATITRALSAVPHYRWHPVRILVDTGSYAAGTLPRVIDGVDMPGGSLAIIGVGDPVAVSGPHTADTVTALGTGGHKLTVNAGGISGAATRWIRILTGTGAGMLIPCAKVDGNDIYIRNEPTTPPGSGCTFEVIEPAVTIACDQALSIVLDDRGDFVSSSYYTAAKVLLCNLSLDFSALTDPECIVVTGRGAESGLRASFVRVTATSSHYWPLTTNSANLNGQTAYDTSAESLSLVSASNLALAGGGAGIIVTGSDYYLTANGLVSVVQDVTHHGILQHQAARSTDFYTCAWKASNWTCLAASVQRCLLDGLGTVFSGKIKTLHAYTLSGDHAWELRGASSLELYDTACDVAGVTGEAVSVEPCSSVVCLDGCAGLVGAGGAYRFTGPSPETVSATWPANHAAASDSMGAFIARRDS